METAGDLQHQRLDHRVANDYQYQQRSKTMLVQAMMLQALGPEDFYKLLRIPKGAPVAPARQDRAASRAPTAPRPLRPAHG
jgi:hypothetical protein